MPLLSITAPTFSRSSKIAKRSLDVVLSVFALVALAPFLLLVAVAIKLDSRGPVHVQRRSGRSGSFFNVYKFRSMYVGSTVEVRADGAIVKMPEDDRITAVGRIIRRFSLDEAPQLLNVLKGDMSLVGPRPLVEAEAAALRDWQDRLADLRPGLTGRGRSPGARTSPSTRCSSSTTSTWRAGRWHGTSRSCWPPCRPCSPGAARSDRKRAGDMRLLEVTEASGSGTLEVVRTLAERLDARGS